MRRAFEAELELARLNQERKQAKDDKDEWRLYAEALLEQAGLTSGVTEVDGQRAMYYQVKKPKFDILNRPEVIEWAKQQDENFIDPEPALRESLIFQECRRLHEANQPLPPGITVRTETEFHKKTLK